MAGVSIATGVVATDALGGGQGRGLQSPGVLAQSASPASVTGTLTETALATVTIPAGAMGLNGALRITVLWSHTNSANTKTLNTRLGGVSGTIISGLPVTTTASTQAMTMLRNRGAANSQVRFGSTTNSFSAFSSAVVTHAVDTSVAQDLVLTGVLTNTGETITVEAYTVELLNP